MIETVLAFGLSVALVQPDIASCALSVDGELDPRDGGPGALRVECNGDDVTLQTAAEATLARMDMNLDRLRRFHSYELAESLVMERSAPGWNARLGQILIKVVPLFPAMAAEYGSTHMLCAMALQPEPDGRLVNTTVACIADVDRATRHMRRNLERALANWRLAPTDMTYCMDEQIYVRAAIRVHGGSPHEPAPMPDPGRLPTLCDTQ